MLNPALYQALKQRFGLIKITREGARRQASYQPGATKEDVLEKGESYDVCCPFCGDTRLRCSVSYAWLSPGRDGRPRRDLIHCYNEGCREFYKESFTAQFEEAVRTGVSLARMAEILTPAPPPPEPMRLPLGCVPLHELPGDHPAHLFLWEKYQGNLDPVKLGIQYGCQWTESPDPRFPFAANRVIFPIYGEGGKLLSWQGRTINPKELKIRWYLPPGFATTIYRYDDIPVNAIPALAEGITSSICCGANGAALFGKTLDPRRAKMIASKWLTAVIVLDPEACVPCYHDTPEGQQPKPAAIDAVQKVLDEHLQYPSIPIEWPEEILAIAREKNLKINKKNKDIKVPDPADIGLSRMREIIGATVRRRMGFLKESHDQPARSI